MDSSGGFSIFSICHQFSEDAKAGKRIAGWGRTPSGNPKSAASLATQQTHDTETENGHSGRLRNGAAGVDVVYNNSEAVERHLGDGSGRCPTCPVHGRIENISEQGDVD